MPRQVKLTLEKNARPEQVKRTKNLINKTKNMQEIQNTPPKHLKNIARYAWRKIVPELKQQKFVKNTDQYVLEQLCSQIALYREAYECIFGGENTKAQGIQTAIFKTIQDSDGNKVSSDFVGYKVNPAVKTMDSAAAKIKSLSESLGMTPQSRAMLLSVIKEDEEPTESLSDILGKAGDF